MNYYLAIPVNAFISLILGMVLCSCTEEKQKPVKNPFDSTIAWNVSKPQQSPVIVCGTSDIAQDMYRALKWMDSFAFLKCNSYFIKQENFCRFIDELQKTGLYTITNYQRPEMTDLPDKGQIDPYQSDSLFVDRFPGCNDVLKLNKQDSVPLNITFSMNDNAIQMHVCTDHRISKKISALLLNKHLAKRLPE